MHLLGESLPLKEKGFRFKIPKSAGLVLGLVLMYLFVSIGLPFLSQLAGFTEEHQVIIEEDIHAGEWFYIFVEQIKEIEPRVTHTLQYTPGMAKPDK
jgi:hypothetical protein